MVNPTDRERAALVALLTMLRPWVEAARGDDPLCGADLVDDLAGWVWGKDVWPGLLDAILEKLGR